MHVRRQVREALLARLAGLPTSGANAFAHRVRPLEEHQLPAVLVAVNAEAMDNNIHGTARRVMEVTVRLVAAAAEGALDDLLDQMASEAEAAIAAAPLAGIPSQNVLLVSVDCDPDAFSMEGELVIGELTLNYLVDVFTAPGQPDIAL